MEIRYRHGKLRQLCEQRVVAERMLGTQVARKLMLRLQELQAASRVNDLIAGRPHPLTGERKGQFALDLAGGWRLVFAPANHPLPLRLDGSVNWSQITIIRIEFIGDYHD